tara:strand:- start:512 stop:1051 length:540 start_codon:yes stop_codon:yes gene_type:complete
MKLVILDRDGVINKDSVNSIKSPEEWIPIEGSLEAISLLNKNGYTVVVATNQSAIGKKLINDVTLDSIHKKMQDLLKKKKAKIDKIFYCPHIEEDNCTCRKPKTGLMQKIKEHYNISLEKIPAIGDSVRDLEAYSKSEARPILVRTGNGKDVEKRKCYPSNTLIFDNLLEVSKFIIKME